jgi:multidrug efflux system membrane fusion protein
MKKLLQWNSIKPVHRSYDNNKRPCKTMDFERNGLFLRSLVLGILLIAILITGCAKKKTFSMPPVPVAVGRVVVQAQPLSLNAVGSVEPVETVSVKAQVGGVITRVDFSEGQDVRAGQLLFQIDPRPFQAALDATMAQLSKDRAQAENADVEAKRYADLVQKDYVTQEQYDAARTQAEVFKSAIKVDEATVEQAKLNMEYASIKAPISGRAGSLLVKKGNVVRANEATLVVINQMHPIRVSFTVPENQLPIVQKFAAVHPLEVHVKTSRTDDRAEAKGRMRFLDNAVDPNTGTVMLKAEFPNSDNSLWPGQFVDVELILTMETNALTVPGGAIVTGQDGTFVFVVGSDKKVEKRPVQVNRTLDDTAVIDGGLKAGEIVVTDGQMRLVPGARVEVKSNPSERGKTR